MKTNSERKRERSSFITVYTVSLNHAQPERTRQLGLDAQIISLLHSRLSTFFKYSKHEAGEYVGLINEGIGEPFTAVKLSEYCRGIIDGFMFATEGMEAHGIMPWIEIATRAAGDFPKGYTNNE